jgi:hypothetical protein
VVVPVASLLYSSGMAEIPQPWEAARDLRWRSVRDIVLDPIAMLGTAVAGWALYKTGIVSTIPAFLLLLAVAVRTADDLLFVRPDGELLRVHPLGPTGFLRVRQAELGWWLHPPRLLVAACVGSQFGFAAGALAWLLGSLAGGLGFLIAIHLRRMLGAQGAAVTWLPAGAAFAADFPDLAAPPPDAVQAGAATAFVIVAVAAARGVEGAYRTHFERLASQAVTQPRGRTRLTWSVLNAVTLPAVDRGVRTRIIRDAVLTLRGQDPQGAILLLLAPLSCLVLVDELAALPTPAAMTWRTLTCAALGGAAVAYAVGPGVHRLRFASMAWERTSPRPGARALTAALCWGMGLATLHGAATLATVALTQNGRFLDDIGGLILPVLGLELAMAHFVVVQVFANQHGKRILGEGTLVLSLPVIAIGVAVTGVLMPLLVPAYFLVTAGMTTAAAARYEAVEVTW